MKSLSKFIGAVILLLILSPVVLAQSQNGLDNRAEKVSYEWPGWWMPAYCGGTHVDDLVGSVSVQGIFIPNKDGTFKANFVMKGEGKSVTTGEVFKIHEIDKFISVEEGYYSHINLIGENGTHYVVILISDSSGGIIGFEKAVCPGN